QPPPKSAKHSQSSPALIPIQSKYVHLTNHSMAELLPTNGRYFMFNLTTSTFICYTNKNNPFYCLILYYGKRKEMQNEKEDSIISDYYVSCVLCIIYDAHRVYGRGWQHNN
ncbi:MAG: hypothetical protein NC092_11420, partial [Butyrivibrio sp.]|nr:hypothetical protein [Butyrivibrio sp.]